MIHINWQSHLCIKNTETLYMNYFRKIRLQEEGKENAYVFCLWYKQQRDKKGRKVHICSVADISHRERYGRDLSFKEKEDGSARD